MTAIIEIPGDLQKDRSELVERAKAHKITDQESYNYAADSFAWARQIEKRIEAHFEPMEEPAKAALDAIRTAKKQALAPILEVKETFSKATAAYEVEQENIRLEAQRKQDEAAVEEARLTRQKKVEEAKAAGASKVMVQQIATAPIVVQSPQIDPTHARSKYVSAPIARWSAKVLGDGGLMVLVKAVAAGKQPLNLLLPNQVALNKIVSALKDKANIPGVEAVCKYTSSAKGV